MRFGKVAESPLSTNPGNSVELFLKLREQNCDVELGHRLTPGTLIFTNGGHLNFTLQNGERSESLNCVISSLVTKLEH